MSVFGDNALATLLRVRSNVSVRGEPTGTFGVTLITFDPEVEGVNKRPVATRVVRKQVGTMNGPSSS